MGNRKLHTAVAQNADLDARLSGYSAVTRISMAAQKLRSRTGNWPIYAAAAGSALAMATSASADVIYFGPSNNYENPGVWGGVLPEILASQPNAQFVGNLELVDALQMDGVNHFVNLLASHSSGFGFVGLHALDKVHIFVTDQSNGIAARRFNSGANISVGAGSAKNVAEIIRSTSANGHIGSFAPGVYGFAGLSVSNIGGDPLKHDYGWIRLKVVTGIDGLPDGLIARDWAFNLASGSAIQAGYVPEPATGPLALLAAGAAGVVALRRRRNLAAEPKK